MIGLGRGEIDFSPIIKVWEVNMYQEVIQCYWDLYDDLYLKRYSDVNPEEHIRYYELLRDYDGREILIDFFTDMKNSFPKK